MKIPVGMKVSYLPRFVVVVITVMCMPNPLTADDAQPVPERKRLEHGRVTRGVKDVEPEPFRDLMPAYRKVPDESNAVPLVTEAVDKLENWPEMKNHLEAFKGNKAKWDRKLCNEFLQKNQQSLNLLEQALQRKWFQPKLVVDMSGEQPGLMKPLPVVRLIEILVLHELDQNNVQAAIDQVRDGLKFAGMVTEADSGSVGFLVAVACYQASFEMANRVIDHADCKQEQLEQLAQLLNQEAAVAERFKEALKFEFLGGVNLCHTFYKSLTGNDIKELAAFAELGLKFGDKPATAMQPNRSCRILAKSIRAAIKRADIPHLEWAMDFKERDDYKRELKKIIARENEQMGENPGASSNAMGEELLLELSGPVEMQIRKVHQLRASQALLLAKCALKSHYLHHKALPGSLDELVPVFMPAVPKDPYDGRNIRYSQKQQRVWSIGPDLLDKGGLEKGAELRRWIDWDEPTIQLPFASGQ